MSALDQAVRRLEVDAAVWWMRELLAELGISAIVSGYLEYYELPAAYQKQFNSTSSPFVFVKAPARMVPPDDKPGFTNYGAWASKRLRSNVVEHLETYWGWLREARPSIDPEQAFDELERELG